MISKLTTTKVAGLQPGPTRYKCWDTELKGYFIRVSPGGTKTFCIAYRNAQGKQCEFTLGIAGKLSTAVARKLAIVKLAEIAQGVDIRAVEKIATTQAQVDLSQTLGAFLDDTYRQHVEHSHKRSKETLRILDKEFGHLHSRRMVEILPLDVHRYQKKKAHLNVETVQRQLRDLKTCINKAVELGVIPHNPLAGMKAPKSDSQGRVRYLDTGELSRLLTALDTRPDYLHTIVILALNTGMRRGELFNLTWSDIDLDRRQITVAGTGSKSGNTRHIPLNNTAFAALTDWRSSGIGLVFPSPVTGKRLNNIGTAWKGIVTEAALTDFRFHDLRHHFASMLVLKGVPLNTVRELLGHASMEMTLRYAHLDSDHKENAVGLLDV